MATSSLSNIIRSKSPLADRLRRLRNGQFVPKPLYSITFKNLLIFLPIFLIALAPLVISYWRDLKETRIANLASRLELIANQSVLRIDPNLVNSLAGRQQTHSGPHHKLVLVLKGIQEDYNVDNAVLIRRVNGKKFEMIADGNNQFFVTQPVFIHERFPETLTAALGAWEMKGKGYTQLFGFGTFEYLQLNKPIRHDGEVVALLLLNVFAEDVDQAIRMETLDVLLLTLVILVLGAMGFWVVSSHLLSPLGRLEDAANQVASGVLGVKIPPLKGRDEVSLLNESFRTMVRELQESRAELEHNNGELKRTLARVRLMEDVEKNLSQFIPRSVRSVLQADPQAIERGKTERDVTVLFLDVESSSKLTEQMEPIRMDHLIQSYFSNYLDFIYENHGDITETAGDGLMIIFQGEDPARHALNAVKTAIAIQKINDTLDCRVAGVEGKLRINIGINSGTALVGFTKYESVSGSRVTFTASGRTTIVAARLQGLAKEGSILVSEETWRRVRYYQDDTQKGWRAEDQGKIMLKNLNDPEHIFRLLPA